jgi:biopolymer transport protein ExbB
MTRAQRGSNGERGRRGGLFGKILAILCLSMALCAAPAFAQAPPQPQTPAKNDVSALAAASASALALEAIQRSEAEPAAPVDQNAAEPGAAQIKPAPKFGAFLPSDLPHDLSPWGMFLNANMIVKIVMVGLGVASLVTWTICLAKSLELWSAKRAARRGLEMLANATNLCGADKMLAPSRAPVALLVSAAVGEAARSAGLPAEGVKERAVALLSRIEAQAGRTMTVGTGALATIGSTAPFVGLFGTVWGIMDSFIGISKTHTTNLAVVAPGIAEALLATAMGLVAAIPAVVIYNVFARSIAGYRALLGDASAEVLRHLSRDLDRDADDTDVIPLRQSPLRRSAE